MVKRVSTGLERLDEITGGGLTPGLTVLVIGDPGSGKTTLMRNFVYQGVAEGDGCLYILTNRSLDQVVDNMGKYGWDVEGKDNMKFLMYNGVVNKRRPSLVGNFEGLVDIAYNCKRLVSSFSTGRKRIIIDDFSYFFLMNNKDAVLKFLQRIGQIVKEEEAVCLLEVQRGMLDPHIVTAVESLTDGSIEMRRGHNKKLIRVPRLEGGKITQSWTGIDILGGESIELEAERTLDEWQNILMSEESPGKEGDIKGALEKVKKEREGPEKKKRFLGLFR